MGANDHYIFMDGCIIKGCKPLVLLEPTFGEYGAVLQRLFKEGHWGRRERRFLGLPLPAESFDSWAPTHVHTAQSTQNMRTGAQRVNDMVEKIEGHGSIHLFGTSAAGAAMLEYFLLCDPEHLYYNPRDPSNERRPARRFKIDRRIASLTTIDAPTNWIPLRRDSKLVPYLGRDSVGTYLARHTRIKAGPGVPPSKSTTRLEDVPGTWVGAAPVAGLVYDNNPHFGWLPARGVERHMYTGSHISEETKEFLERVWR